MESKVKTLKQILTIGAFILLIAGISFQFATSIEDYYKVPVMLLISGVFVFLSFYEERALNYKSGSLISHILACVSVLVAFISAIVLGVFGEWFSVDGAGDLISIACVFFLAALLLAVSVVRYKVYKLIELSVWISLIGVYIISIHFEADGYLSLIALLGVLFVNNIFRMNSFSKWFTIAINIIAVIFINSTEFVLSSILLVVMLLNLFFIMFKERKTVIIPLIVSLAGISLYAVDAINSTIVGVGAIAIIDFLVLYFKLHDSNKKKIFHKVIINLFYLLLVFIPTDMPFKVLIPCIVLISSLVNIYLVKDEYEELLLPVKAFYFVAFEMCNIEIVSFKTCVVLFSANFVNLLLYLFSKKKSVSYVNLAIMALINAIAFLQFESELIPLIIYLILFYLDFYIVYMKEEQLQLPLTVIFIIFTSLVAFKTMGTEDIPYFLVASMIYLLYLWLARKNKFVYGASLVGFIISILQCLGLIITNETAYALVCEIVISIGIFFLQYIIDNHRNKSLTIGIIAGLQIGYTLLFPFNIIVKVYVLVESIALIALSMIDDDFKSLGDEGLVLTIISLLVIIGTIDNLPKSVYLIIVGLTIVISVPIFIKKYLNKIEENKKIEAEKPKEEVKVEIKENTTETKYAINFCGNCGNKVEGDYKFCPKCGSQIR